MYRTKGLGVAYQDIVSALLLFFHPASFFFILLSSFFRCREPRTVLLLSLPFSPSPPPAASRALYSFHVSRVKLCAISLTFDNRCSSGNYIPSVLATNLLLHFSSPLLFKLAHTCALIFRSPRWTFKCIIRKKLKSLHREFLHPSRRLDFPPR